MTMDALSDQTKQVLTARPPTFKSPSHEQFIIVKRSVPLLSNILSSNYHIFCVHEYIINI